MTDPDLQKLIEAKKVADHKRLQKEENDRKVSAKADEVRIQAEVDWKDLAFAANAEAGRINSVSQETGITIAGLQGERGTISVGYRFTRDKIAVQVDVKFSRSGNDVLVSITPTKRVPAFEEMRKIEQVHAPKKVDVGAILNDVARQMIEA